MEGGVAARHSQFLEHFVKHESSLFAFVVSRGIRGSGADDVLQSIAMVLWEKFDDFEPGTNFKAWAFSVARIEILRFVGDQKRHSRLIRLDAATLDELESLEMEEPDGLVSYRRDILLEGVSKLGDNAKSLVRLRYGDGLPIDEMAEQLRATSAAVRVRLFRVRKWLGNCVQANIEGA